VARVAFRVAGLSASMGNLVSFGSAAFENGEILMRQAALLRASVTPPLRIDAVGHSPEIWPCRQDVSVGRGSAVPGGRMSDLAGRSLLSTPAGGGCQSPMTPPLPTCEPYHRLDPSIARGVTRL